MATYQRTKSDAKKLSRTAKRGDHLYVVVEVDQRVAPYEDARLCSRFTVTGTHPILGGAMIGSMSVERLVYEHGPVYTSPPGGFRKIHDSSPQVAGPLGHDTERILDDAEISGLEKQVRDAADARQKSRRRWF